MEGRISALYVMYICCVVLNAGVHALQVGNDHDVSHSQRQTKSYAEFLDDFSTTVQRSGDPQHAAVLEGLNDELYDLYLSVRTSFPRRRNDVVDNDKPRDDSNRGVVNMAMPQDDRIQPEENSFNHDRSPTPLRAILDSLEKVAVKQNTSSNSTCIEDIGRLCIGLMNSQMWALEFLDAAGKPGPGLLRDHINFVGDYDQCRAATTPSDPEEKSRGFTGSYFRMFLLTPIPSAILRPQFGVCLPDTCSSAEISLLAQEIVVGKKIANIPITYAYGQRIDAPTEMTVATITAIAVLSAIGFLMVIGTIVDMVILKSWRQPEEQPLGQIGVGSQLDSPSGYNRGYGDTENRHYDISDDTSPLIYSPYNTNANSYTVKRVRFRFIPKLNCKCNPSNVLVKIFLAFSVYSNGKKLLSTKQNPGSVGAIHGIRFLSMSWVVLCHWYAFSMPYTLNAIFEMPNLLKRWSFLPIANGFSSVDTFFTLSGILTSYITIREMKRRQTAKINWFMFYFHRFWRLTPPYMLSILIVLGLSQYLGQGPLWKNSQPADKANCEKNWWTNLLYVNNLVNADAGCFGHSWYLANDMQFFVLSPLMLLPFYFKRIYGLLSCFLILLASCVSTGVLSMIHKWPTTTVSLKPDPDRASPTEWFFHYYIVPWCRIGPFVMGIVAGYVLAITKGRQFRMRWWVVAVGWIFSIACGLAVVYGLRGDITGDEPTSLRLAALYNAVSRPVWGACVSWVVIACSAGYGGPVNSFLSWSPFVVLGRLTYLVYLIHLSIGGTAYQNLGALLYFNDTTMVITFVGVFACVNMIAFVAVLALESPMLALEKIFFKRDSGS